MNTRGLDWIDGLPPELAGQRALLRGLLALCDADDRISWLVIGCSLARGAGDRLSDLDMAMGIRDEDFEAARPDLRRAVDGLGELVESYYHQLPGADLDPGRLLDATRRVAALLHEAGWPVTSPRTSSRSGRTHKELMSQPCRCNDVNTAFAPHRRTVSDAFRL
jgi:hypothetical protein